MYELKAGSVINFTKAKIIPSIFFCIISYFVFDFRLWLISNLVIILTTLMPSKKNVWLVLSPFFLVFFQAGIYKYLNEIVSFKSDYLLSNNIVKSSILLSLFILFQIFCFYFSKQTKNFALSKLTFILLSLVTVVYLNFSPLVSDLFKIFSFLVIRQFFMLILNSEIKNLTPADSIMGNMQIWNMRNSLPIPLQLLQIKSNIHDFSQVQWSGIKLLIINMGLAVVYNFTILQITHNEIKDLYLYFQFRNGSTFDGLFSLISTHTMTASWLGFLLIGFGVFTKITISVNYSVALARMVGFDLPAAVTERLYTFKSFNGLMQGIYFYYNYLLVHLFYPRIKKIFSLFFNRISHENAQRLIIFFVVSVGGIFHNLVSFDYLFDKNRTFFEIFEHIILTLMYYVPLGIVIIASRMRLKKQTRSYNQTLIKIASKIWIILGFCILLLIKTTIKYRHWNLDQLFNYFSQLFTF